PTKTLKLCLWRGARQNVYTRLPCLLSSVVDPMLAQAGWVTVYPEEHRMRGRRYILLGLLCGALTLMGCARFSRPVDTSQSSLISNGMSEDEVIQRLGPPGMIAEQPRMQVRVPIPNGVEFREKRRYTYYYPGTSQSMDMLITFED